MPQIQPENLPVDPADLEQDAGDFFEVDIDTCVQSLVILGQLDPTEIDLKTGLPRWTPEQMTVIVKANDWLSERQD